MQKLIIVPLYIQCETAGGETQCAGSLNFTAEKQYVHARIFTTRATCFSLRIELFPSLLAAVGSLGLNKASVLAPRHTCVG